MPATAPTRIPMQVAAAVDAEEAAQQQAAALQQRLALLAGKLNEVEEERRAELAPSLREAKDDVALLRRCGHCSPADWGQLHVGRQARPAWPLQQLQLGVTALH